MDPKALYKLGYGVYVIGARKGDKLNAQIANTVFQITSEPPSIAVSINKKNLTWEYIHESQAFSASVLCQDTPLSFIGHFGFKSGREVDKFEGVNYKIGATGAPVILDNAVSYLEVKVKQEIDVGTHTIFIGEVVDAAVLVEKACLTYEYYQQVKRGTTPRSAPSYHEPVKETVAAGVAPASAALQIPSKSTLQTVPAPAQAPVQGKAAAPTSSPSTPKLAKYKCLVCGWVYDPNLGDPDGGIKPGTPFESIPDGWVCPVCGADKSQFEKIAE